MNDNLSKESKLMQRYQGERGWPCRARNRGRQSRGIYNVMSGSVNSVIERQIFSSRGRRLSAAGELCHFCRDIVP